MLKAIIFDFDGVLVDTFDVSMSILAEQNRPTTREIFKDHHNGNVFEKPAITFTPEEGDDYFGKYQEKANKNLIFPLKDQLKELAQKYKLFIVSSQTERGIHKYLELDDYKDYFENIYGYETEKSKKKKFRMIFEQYDLSVDECIFVTDTLGDLLESAEVGVKTIAVTWGYHGERRLKLGKPNLIIHDFHQLTEAIDSFMKN